MLGQHHDGGPSDLPDDTGSSEGHDGKGVGSTQGQDDEVGAGRRIRQIDTIGQHLMARVLQTIADRLRQHPTVALDEDTLIALGSRE